MIDMSVDENDEVSLSGAEVEILALQTIEFF